MPAWLFSRPLKHDFHNLYKGSYEKEKSLTDCTSTNDSVLNLNAIQFYNLLELMLF